MYYRNHLKKYRLSLWIFFIIYLLFFIFGLYYWINSRIIDVYGTSSLMQVEIIKEENKLDQIYISDLLQITEKTEVERGLQWALIQDGQVEWQEVNDSNLLKRVLLDFQDDWPTTMISSLQRKGLTLVIPIQSENSILHLVKYYPRNVYVHLINRIYLWFTIVFIIGLLILVFVYHWQKYLISEPIKSLHEGVNKISLEDYTYEYLGSVNPDVDSLGQSLNALSHQLKNKKTMLESSEQRLSLLLDYLTLGVILIDDRGTIQLMNPEAKFLMNIEKLPSGRNYQSILRSYSLVELVDKAIRNNQHINDEIEIYTPKSRFIDVNIIPYNDSLADSDSVLVLLYDITQVRRLETVRTEFVSNASHELRTPVTAIKGFAETLLEGAMNQTDLSEKFIAIIYNESNRLEVLINDILELSRVEKQVDPIVSQSVDLVTILEKLVHHFSASAKEKNIELELMGISHVNLYIDEHRLEQVFINLIENAINYSDNGGKIEVEVKKIGDKVITEVRDQGMGIPEEDQERVFERFYRVDKGRSRNSGGTGLGLSIVRNLIKNMNGKISLDSKIGQGSTFTVELPTSPPH